MSGVNIPQDPRSIDKLISHSKSEEETTSIPLSKDSVEKFSSYELSTESTKPVSDAPQLQPPEIATDSISMMHYFKLINSATLNFRHQLSASDLVDQQSRFLRGQLTVSQAESLIKLYEARQLALNQLGADAKQALEEIQKALEKMQKGTKEQQDLIDLINKGNELEKQKHQELSQAYNAYLNKLKSIGAIDNGDGTYSVPKEALDQFKAFTQEYQQAVGNFNSYWKERKSQLEQYNSAAVAYNKSVAANNQLISNLINKYQLADFLKNMGLTIPTQKEVGLRDLSGYLQKIQEPNFISPLLVSIPPLPPYAQLIGSVGPPSLPQLDAYTPINSQSLYQVIYNTFYVKRITSIDQEIQSNYAYWSFLSAQRNSQSVHDTISDPLLNTKRLALKILPAAFIESNMPIKPSSIGISDIVLQAMGFGNSHLADILGRALLRKALDAFNLKLFEGKEAQVKEQKINELVNQLLILSVGLLGNQSLQALLPSFSLISQSLDLLPQDSPAFAILFAISFSNRVQEDAKQGITAETLHTFLNKNLDLDALPAEDQSKLEAILNLGQLLIAAKLLESNLGLQGLLGHLLPSLLPSIDSSLLLSQAAQEAKQNLVELKAHLEGHFVNQGYPKEEAQFLAQMGSQLTEHGLLTPTATSLTSVHKFNSSLLVDSVKASLVLDNYSLKQSHAIAHEAVENALAEGPFHSTRQFRTALAAQLQDLGVRDTSPEIALQAILIPPAEEALNLLTPQLPPLTPPELISILEKRSLQLLMPQLGAQVAQQVTEEMTKTLFGNSHSSEVKSPYSLVNMLQAQLDQLKAEQNEEWTNSVSEAFKETIKTMENFYAFSLKLMDPAYLFVYSAQTGIIYGEQGKKKSIDILI